MTTAAGIRRRPAGVVAALLVLLAACTPSAAAPLERAAEEPTLAAGVAVAAGERFLDDYVDDDGRVVRRDEGGDTVSEGQAYGMLVAVALEDRDRFDAIWSWTQANLQRDDGLLAWRWADGDVADAMPATDADLDTAHALVLAASVFADPDLAREAARIGRAVLDHATTEGRLGPVAVAGPWATGEDGSEPWVNPSYGTPVAFDVLAELTDDPTWEALDASARRVVAGATVASDLPPDWAVLTPDAVEPRPAPGRDGDAVHGYDAVRTAVRYAVDCDPEGRALAAAMDDEYDGAARSDGGPAAVLTLAGAPAADHGHPAASVGAAAAALAAGDGEDSARLLTVAERQLESNATYYGSAWVALGRLWLTTGRLGGCAGS
jgi:endoglucanase